jgi:uncharacterized protein YhaN
MDGPSVSATSEAGRDAELRRARAQIASLREVADALQAREAELQLRQAALEGKLREEQAEVARIVLQCETKTRVIGHQRTLILHLRQELNAAGQRNRYLEERVQQMLQSTSWRLTGPLRFAAVRFRLRAARPGFGRTR